MLIRSTKTLRFHHPAERSVTFDLPAGDFVQVPDWVRDSVMYATAYRDATLTVLGDDTKPTAVAPSPVDKRTGRPVPQIPVIGAAPATDKGTPIRRSRTNAPATAVLTGSPETPAAPAEG